jgi:anti-anti-sigma factor
MSDFKAEIKSIENYPNSKIVSIIGDAYDFNGLIAISNQVISAIESGSNKLIFDLSQLGYITSAGIGGLLGFRDKCNKKGGTICIVGANQNIIDTLKLAGIIKLFKMYETVDDAIEKSIKGTNK